MSKRTEAISEFSRLSRAQLLAQLSQKREALRQFRFDLASGKAKNAAEIRQNKKDIARILTILNQKQLG